MAGQTSHMICAQNKYFSTCIVINTNIPLHTCQSTRTFLDTEVLKKDAAPGLLNEHTHHVCPHIQLTHALQHVCTGICLSRNSNQIKWYPITFYPLLNLCLRCQRTVCVCQRTVCVCQRTVCVCQRTVCLFSTQD